MRFWFVWDVLKFKSVFHHGTILAVYKLSFVSGLSAFAEFCKKIAEQESKGGPNSLSDVPTGERQLSEDEDANAVFSGSGLKAPTASGIILNIRVRYRSDIELYSCVKKGEIFMLDLKLCTLKNRNLGSSAV